MAEREHAIFMFKPDGKLGQVGQRSLVEITTALLHSAGLNIERTQEVQLDEHKVNSLYKILNQPSEYGEDWKRKVIEALQETTVLSFLVSGTAANRRARIIKDFLRAKLTYQHTQLGLVVKNIAHVVDDEDFEVSYKILFST